VTGERLVRDPADGTWKCVSCYLWNCWHAAGEHCDVPRCGCERGRRVIPEPGSREP
jgi:hypothetical protein